VTASEMALKLSPRGAVADAGVPGVSQPDDLADFGESVARAKPSSFVTVGDGASFGGGIGFGISADGALRRPSAIP